MIASILVRAFTRLLAWALYRSLRRHVSRAAMLWPAVVVIEVAHDATKRGWGKP